MSRQIFKIYKNYSVIGHNSLELLKNGFSGTIKRPHNISDLEFQNICDKIKKQYLGDEAVSDKTVEKIVDVRTRRIYL